MKTEAISPSKKKRKKTEAIGLSLQNSMKLWGNDDLL
jgi:hypothetical protein